MINRAFCVLGFTIGTAILSFNSLKNRSTSVSTDSIFTRNRSKSTNNIDAIKVSYNVHDKLDNEGPIHRIEKMTPENIINAIRELDSKDRVDKSVIRSLKFIESLVRDDDMCKNGVYIHGKLKGYLMLTDSTKENLKMTDFKYPMSIAVQDIDEK